VSDGDFITVSGQARILEDGEPEAKRLRWIVGAAAAAALNDWAKRAARRERRRLAKAKVRGA
jgi:hypothetical protein